MIVFYTDTKKVKSLPKVVATDSCATSCASSCIKPKNKCCNKYKKKGINCKRCPLTFDIKIAS